MVESLLPKMFIVACSDEAFAKEIKFTAICTSREANFASPRNVAFSRKQGTMFGNVSVCNNNSALWARKKSSRIT